MLAGALAVARRWLVVVQVTGPSMEPAYRSGDRALVPRVAGTKLGRDQAVVFEAAPGGRWRTGPLSAPKDAKWLIKRVTALPGVPAPPAVPEGRWSPQGGWS